MYSVSNENFLTSKHCAVELGLHTLTGLKQPIVYTSRLGHSNSPGGINSKIEIRSLNLFLAPRHEQGKVSYSSGPKKVFCKIADLDLSLISVRNT